MALEKPIIKSSEAEVATYDYKPRDFVSATIDSARSFVDKDGFRSPDFRISALVAQQTGISQMESDALQDKINNQVLERLKESQEKAYKEGYDLGRTDGTEKAFQESKAALLERMTSVETLLKKIEDLKSHLLVDNEGELIQLVFLTAKKIALRDLEGNREAVQELLRTVVGETKAEEQVVVRLSAQDLNFLEALQEKSGQKIERLERVKFVPDESIQSGGCVIESQFGSVNATVEERVERVWATLQARIPQNAPGKKE